MIDKETDLDIVIKDFEYNFVEQYPTWKGVLDQFNITVAENIALVMPQKRDELEPIGFNNFCKMFLEYLKKFYDKEVEMNQVFFGKMLNRLTMDIVTTTLESDIRKKSPSIFAEAFSGDITAKRI